MSHERNSTPDRGPPDKPRPSDEEMQRKRARDRRSQKAMRDRAKWTVDSLTEQVRSLTEALEGETHRAAQLDFRVQNLQQENSQLRTEVAALQLQAMEAMRPVDHPSTLSSISTMSLSPEMQEWQRFPLNVSPTCLADQIFQGLLSAQLSGHLSEMVASTHPDLSRLIESSAAHGGDANDVILDIVRSYTEIDSLPKQVAVHFVMFSLARVGLLRSVL